MQLDKDKKKKSSGLGMVLYEDRFVNGNKIKKCIQRNSVIEFSSIGKLSEKMEMESKVVYNAKECGDIVTIDAKYPDVVQNLNFTLSIPPRVPYQDVSKNDYKELEALCFNKWKRINDTKIFERNIEIWRQFWLSCERAETIIQIVDSRNPEAYLNRDIIEMYPTKKHLVFCNKSDLLPEKIKMDLLSRSHPNMEFFLYSTKNEIFDYKLSGVIAMIGYPNVGKSSTIN
jgi:large subunit GTPase 1